MLTPMQEVQYFILDLDTVGINYVCYEQKRSPVAQETVTQRAARD